MKQEDSNHDDASTLFKNKIDIEKELFEEFNNKKVNDVSTKDEEIDNVSLFDDKIDDEDVSIEESKSDDTILDKIESKMSNNKFPDMSIDEYMKNFDENELEKSGTLSDFGDDFPSIPI